MLIELYGRKIKDGVEGKGRGKEKNKEEYGRRGKQSEESIEMIGKKI